MTHPVTGIDHIVLLVGDLEVAARRFERLGFTLSPRGTHSPHMGSANYTIIFPNDYFELLGVIAETPRNAGKREILAARGDSMTAIACRIGDVHVAREALSELGIATSEAMDFSRPLPLPDGSTGMAAFSVSTFAPQEVPNGEMFMCGHKTRDMVWRPELMTHANGARALAGIIVATETPDEMTKAYARLFADSRIETLPDGMRVATGAHSAVIECMKPDAVSARYASLEGAGALHGSFAALQIGVADLAKARLCLESTGVRYGSTPGGKSIFVSAADAGGTVLEFVEQ